MSGAADSVAFCLQEKTAREMRLRWQSHILLAIVLLPAAVGLLRTAASARTPATAEGLAICAGFGLLVWLLRAATPLAAATGFVLTSCLYLLTVQQPDGGWLHTALLPGFTLFVLAFAATRFRRSQKEQSGLAESRRGRRASQVAANMGAAALVVILPARWLATLAGAGPVLHSWTGSQPTALAFLFLFPALVAALAEAAADTVSSEVGQAIGGLPWLVTSRRRVPPGTDGGITLAGTAAGCVAAALVVAAAVPSLRLGPRQAAIAWIAAVAGFFADSILGATVERGGWLNNDAVNFFSTAVAALCAGLLLRISLI